MGAEPCPSSVRETRANKPFRPHYTHTHTHVEGRSTAEVLTHAHTSEASGCVCCYLEKNRQPPRRQTAEWHNQATAEARSPQGERVRKMERQTRQTVRAAELLRSAPDSSNEARRMPRRYISLRGSEEGYHSFRRGGEGSCLCSVM